MATKQLTSLDTYVVPRVNLLPPEIGAKRAERRSYAMMGAAVAGAVAAVVVLYMGQASRVSSAKQELTAAKSESARLKTERVGLQSVQDVYLAVEADEALLTRALNKQVRWSVYLHNISVSLPENVWVTSFSGTVANAGAPGTGAIGAMSFAGKAFAYNDVAAWLESIAKIKGVTNSYFSSAAKTDPASAAGRPIISFSSTASLTQAAVTPHTKPGSR